jgi:hypothetical protein
MHNLHITKGIMGNPRTSLARWQWILLAAIVVAASVLRFHHLSNIFLWVDETDFFNERVFLNPPQPLLAFMSQTRDATTNTWGWPAILWIACRFFGGTLQVARTPGALAGTAMVLAIFFLVHRLLPKDFTGSRFIPAIGAATLAAIAMPQMEFSQRTYPYAAAPLMGAVLLLADLYVFRELADTRGRICGLVHSIAWYTVVASIVVCIHPSLNILVALSMIFLAVKLMRTLPNIAEGQRYRLLCWSATAAAIVYAFVFLNRKNPKYGFRPYITPYYHDISLHSIPKFLLHIYDLGTYHLNLFYNARLYWPERLNVAILPLILLCAVGWWLSATGRYGPFAKHLARLCAATVAVIAALSFVRLFPFGGVRQTLFLSPFLLVFAVLGMYALRATTATKVAAGILVAGYLSLWAINLPRFYSERLAQYDAAELVRDSARNGGIGILPWYCDQTVRYWIRDRPNVPVLKQAPKAPFLLVSTRRPLENIGWWQPLYGYLQESGYKITLIDHKPPAHLDSLKYSGSLYFPPNGLWVYLVTN